MAWTRFIPHALLAILLAVGPLVARGQADDAPARYVDGEALANRITPWLLKNTHPKFRNRDHLVHWLNFRLWEGSAFTPGHMPDRVALMEWMLAQPDHSIQPHALYQQAFKITGGDLQKGMMLVWDTLATRSGLEERRNTFPHILKLVDITGELDAFDGMNHSLPAGYPLEKVPKKYRSVGDPKIKAARGDNMSAWYHLSGTALHAYLKASSRFNLIKTKRHTDLLIYLEEYVLHNEYVDPLKRVEIDRAGAAFGWKLADNLNSYKTAEAFEKSPDAGNTHYLYDNTALYGDTWRLKEGQRPLDYGTDRATKTRPGLILRFREAQRLGRELQADPGNPKTFAALEEYLRDTNIAVREEAALWLVQDAAPFARERIMGLFSGASTPEIRVAIGTALANQGTPDALELAKIGIRSSHAVYRELGFRILTHAPESDESLVLIRRGLMSDSALVRASTLVPLDKLTSPAAQAQVAELAQSIDIPELARGLEHAPAYRTFPLLLIRILLEGPQKPVPVSVHSEWSDYRRVAVERLLDHDGPVARQLLMRAAGDKDAAVRRVARLILRSRQQDQGLPPEPMTGCLGVWRRILKQVGQ